MRTHINRGLVVAFIVLVGVGSAARASQDCCDCCGRAAPCCKVCRLVCEEEKVEVVCYGCKCEDFCLPCPSKRGCKHAECVCGQCEAGECARAPRAKPKRFVWFDWFPGGAKIFTRTKLMRKTETVTLPRYKWVVEDLCPECAAVANDEPPGKSAEN